MRTLPAKAYHGAVAGVGQGCLFPVAARSSGGTWLAFSLCLCLTAGAAVELPEAYRVIAQRNLFSPSRTPAVAHSGPIVPPAPPPTETVTLTGVALLEGRPTALFTGSTPGLNGVRRPGERLDIGAVGAVDLAGATIDTGTDGGTLRLSVGQSLRRIVGQPWAVSSEAVPLSASASAAAPATAPAAAPGAAPVGGSSDMLQRLLERRKKELGQ